MSFCMFQRNQDLMRMQNKPLSKRKKAFSGSKRKSSEKLRVIMPDYDDHNYCKNDNICKIGKFEIEIVDDSLADEEIDVTNEPYIYGVTEPQKDSYFEEIEVEVISPPTLSRVLVASGKLKKNEQPKKDSSSIEQPNSKELLKIEQSPKELLKIEQSSKELLKIEPGSNEQLKIEPSSNGQLIIEPNTKEQLLKKLSSNKRLDPCVAFQSLYNLFTELKDVMWHPYVISYNPKDGIIDIVEYYRNKGKASSIKLCVCIDQEFNMELYVHGNLIPPSHDVWVGRSQLVRSAQDVTTWLAELSEYIVCIGHPDVSFQQLLPIGKTMCQGSETTPSTYLYREGDFGATQGTLLYHSTFRSSNCGFLIKTVRCCACRSYRSRLRRRLKTMELSVSRDVSLSSSYKHCDMTNEMLIKKLEKQAELIKSLKKDKNQLQHKLRKETELKPSEGCCEGDSDT